jgi:hypothetical protein
MRFVEARSASLRRMDGALAPRVWAYAAALLAAFVLTYAIAASGSHQGASAGASQALADEPSVQVRQVKRLRDVEPLPRIAPAEVLR